VSNPRDTILAGIRRSLGRGALDAETVRELKQRLAQPVRNTVPQRGQLPIEERTALFVQMAEAVDATVDQLGDLSQVPSAVGTFCQVHGLIKSALLAADPELNALDWGEAGFTSRTGLPQRDDLLAITPAFAAAAETGTLVTRSGPDHASSLNLLPDNHIVVLHKAKILASYEDTWDLLRKAYPQGLPRTVLWITGPSRTGDIEQTLQLGAHGPRRLHILIVG